MLMVVVMMMMLAVMMVVVVDLGQGLGGSEVNLVACPPSDGYDVFTLALARTVAPACPCFGPGSGTLYAYHSISAATAERLQVGPSQPAKRSKRTKAEPEPAEPTKGKGKATKAKPAPQPGRWLDRDCNAALNMQRIGESKWRPLELCYWPQQGALPAKGKEYFGLGYKRLRDKPLKAQQQQQPAEAQ
ncbi:hypothetical protein QJQ45_000267 [Haematococcus lacustris]|nr:hypothetical protein QJQ45_000267 [Haematococcus lacustris]